MSSIPIMRFEEVDTFQLSDRNNVEVAPKDEGVYCLLAEVDNSLCVLYVGTAQNIRSRLKNHIKHPSPWTIAAHKTTAAFPWQLDGDKPVRVNGWFNRGEEEMRLLWDYLPPWNKAYSFNRVFVPLAQVVINLCFFDLYPDIRRSLKLNDMASSERKLRSLLSHSGIERRTHYRVDGQVRVLLNRNEFDHWLVSQTGLSYNAAEQAREAKQAEDYERHMVKVRADSAAQWEKVMRLAARLPLDTALSP